MTSTTRNGGALGRLRARWGYLALAGAVAALDQLTKLLVVRSVTLDEVVTVIPGFFAITHVLNPGGVWGLGRDIPAAVRVAVFLALPTVITIFAAWYSLQLSARAWVRQAAIALIVGGAIGNLVDRVRLQHVVDFLRFHVGSHSWPDFNVADSAICLGVGTLLATTLLERDDDDPLAGVGDEAAAPIGSGEDEAAARGTADDGLGGA